MSGAEPTVAVFSPRFSIFAKVLGSYALVWPVLAALAILAPEMCVPPHPIFDTANQHVGRSRPCSLTALSTNLPQWSSEWRGLSQAFFIYFVISLVPALFLGSAAGAWQATRGRISATAMCLLATLPVLAMGIVSKPYSVWYLAEPLLVSLLATLLSWRVTRNIVPLPPR